MQLTDSTANMMISTLNDPEEPFTPELEQTATSVTGCLTNVLKSAAGSSKDKTDSAVAPPSPEVKITSTFTSMTNTEITPFSIHSLIGVSFLDINSGWVNSKQYSLHQANKTATPMRAAKKNLL